jgi:hypothetical protein
MPKKYTNLTNVAGMSSNQTEYFAYTVHKNGKSLEDRVERQLLANGIQFKKNTHSGIDFIIDGEIYMDCVSTSQSGSIDDKLPTKCFKYLKKYKIKEIYILHPYSPIEKHVAEHFEFLENAMDVKIHMLDWADFCYICNGSKFEQRKPYRITKNGASVKNHKTGTHKINQFFEFKH